MCFYSVLITVIIYLVLIYETLKQMCQFGQISTLSVHFQLTGTCRNFILNLITSVWHPIEIVQISHTLYCLNNLPCIIYCYYHYCSLCIYFISQVYNIERNSIRVGASPSLTVTILWYITCSTCSEGLQWWVSPTDNHPDNCWSIYCLLRCLLRCIYCNRYKQCKSDKLFLSNTEEETESQSHDSHG